jgi:tripartite-type tricarboxylate transporter receptor subunit TctC
MKTFKILPILGSLASLYLSTLGLTAWAQDYPRQPIKIVVPWAPGGNVDITARTVAPALSEILGQQVVVENKPGAGGFIGTLGVVRATPDGYTLLLGSSGSIAVGPALDQKAPYDPTKDLTAIGPIHEAAMVLSVSAKGQLKTFADFTAKATGVNSAVSIGSAGNGSSQHLALELLALKMQLKLTHIPYKGSGPALNDAVGGQIDSILDQVIASIGHIKNGTLIAIAQSGNARSALLPTVPTFQELGAKDVDIVTFTGLFGPVGMPVAVIDKLNTALKQALSQKSVQERFSSLGVEIMTLDRAAFAQYVSKDFETSKAIGKAANIVINQ